MEMRISIFALVSYSRNFYNAYGPSTPNPMHYQILCIIGNGMLYMTKQRGNLVNAQPYALPDFMHYLLCIIEISTVVPILPSPDLSVIRQPRTRRLKARRIQWIYNSPPYVVDH